ncbi:ATP-dependent RNA helicase DeaD [Salinihabitans flavidus]|uniref:ATP-dependent RNA helicase DeaD n=1 Tax=Salinihabitans flavidus TaxID=569882 RepID=A0A1H8V946_9RHOB|nr:DEAD/DEAH box helicase [Salinihabitans flavidus]SEP11793.1 ATP-dependent RNA helicase DeaD [Salinihabitans flavidus]
MIKTLSDALAERGYDTLTPVQEAVTAPELQEADLLVSAQTGSGKTVGFGLAIAHTLLGTAERLGPAAAPLALVVAPTRELAFQVMRELSWLYAGAGARVVSCVGGMDMRDERRALERGAHIVVGTPGRLRDHIQRGSLDLGDLRAVVLDEADEMLDLGFREDLEFMLGAAPADRRTLMFSATVPPMIATLAKQFQRDAVRVTTQTGSSQHADIAYQALRVAETDAENAIINVLRFHDAQNALVFANTRAAVNRLMARFSNRGFSVVSLSGELSQTERTHALQAMRDGRARVCVATDVAARGIDLPKLELVIHADLPTNAEALLHRSGRTGRAGRKGISALIVTPRTTKKAERLLKFAKIRADWSTAPTAEEILRRDEERLLSDPVWTEDTTEEQDAFAAKLLDLHTPEKIAAAYLRLYRARQSAPEDLSPPDAKSEPKDRKPFGPSVWISLSVGHKDKAEARWLLPLLCRAGNLSKDAIGAIRVQPSETFVELSEGSLQSFLSALGPNGELEEGITARKLDGPPDLSPQSRGPGPQKARDTSARPAPDRKAKPHQPANDPPGDKPRQKAPEKADKPRRSHPNADAAHGPASAKRAPAKDRKGGSGAPHSGKPSGKPADPSSGYSKQKATGKPATARPGAADTSKRMERPGKPAKAKAAATKSVSRKPKQGAGQEPPKRQKR